mgnify:CR=1 FL=1
MANIYDIAKIASGDPMGRVKEGARETSALFAQYQHQKDIIKEINEAIADAKSKSKKGKLGSSILGSLLGMGAGALTGGITTPWLAKGLGALGAGAGSYIAEKGRRDKYKPTQKLKELKQKLKGRRQYEDVAATEEVFSDQLDAMMQGDVMSNILASLMIPVGMEEVSKGGASIENLEGAFQKGWPKIGPEALTSYGSDAAKSVASDVAKKSINIPWPELDTEMFKGIMPEMFKGLADKESMQDPILLSLLRALGPSAYGALATPEVTSSPYAQPQFRNPYRGGY